MRPATIRLPSPVYRIAAHEFDFALSARKFTLALARQPVNVIASFSRVSALAPLHWRPQQTATQNETAASVCVMPPISHRHLPTSVLPLASLLGLPALWACDQGRVP